jgi:uncharacterized phiE125 gp8 family phage protein
MSLVSVATLKNYLPEITGTTADTELGNLLNRVESDVARWLGFPVYDSGSTPVLTQQTYTLYLDGPMYNNETVLQLPFKPLVSVTTIHSDADREYGSDTRIQADEFDLDLQNARVILKTNVATEGFATAFRAIKVVCVSGFGDSHPLDLEHAICVFASQLHRNKMAQGKESTGQRGAAVKYSPKSLPFEVKEILYPLRSSAMIL